MLRISLATLFLASLACAGGGTEDDEDGRPPRGGGDADTDTDSDTDTDTDADTDTDTDVDLGNACGELSAIEAGREWEWFYDDGSTAYTMTQTVDSFDGESGVLHSESTFDNATYTMTYSTDTEFRCDDGLIYERATTEYAGESGGTPVSGESTTIYDQGGPALPTSVAAGESWSVQFSGETVSSPGGTADFAYIVFYTAEGRRSIEVPAGTYDAWELTTVTDSGGTESQSTTYVAPNVGGVRMGAWELIRYEP